MLLTESHPPHANGMTWSTAHPVHAPVCKPVAGHAYRRRKAATAFASRAIAPLAVLFGSPHIRVSSYGEAKTLAEASVISSAVIKMFI